MSRIPKFFILKIITFYPLPPKKNASVFWPPDSTTSIPPSPDSKQLGWETLDILVKLKGRDCGGSHVGISKHGLVFPWIFGNFIEKEQLFYYTCFSWSRLCLQCLKKPKEPLWVFLWSGGTHICWCSWISNYLRCRKPSDAGLDRVYMIIYIYIYIQYVRISGQLGKLL